MDPLLPSKKTGVFPPLPPEETNPQQASEQVSSLIAEILENPGKELSIEESLELLANCLDCGQWSASLVSGKELWVVLGNTGAGKSTFINYLAGCTMELKAPKELGLKGPKKLVRVKPRSEGGVCDPLMKIGHCKNSQTLIPEVKADSEGQLYCDAPGFFDNRCDEFRIAHAVNIKNTLNSSGSVKVLILINYHSLLADRAKGFSEMLQLCLQLFGSKERFEGSIPSLLVGLSHVPLDMDFDSLKEWLLEDAPDYMPLILDRLFIFDPLDPSCRLAVIDRIKQLPSINYPSTLFKTSLSPTEEQKLQGIIQQLGQQIKQAIESRAYSYAASRLSSLHFLRVLDHSTLELQWQSQLESLTHLFIKKAELFKEFCYLNNFAMASEELKDLKEALGHFNDHLQRVVDLKELIAFQRKMEEEHQQREARMKLYQEQLVLYKELETSLKGENTQLQEKLKEQTQRYKAAVKKSKEKHAASMLELHIQLDTLQKTFDDNQAALTKLQSGQQEGKECQESLKQLCEDQKEELEISERVLKDCQKRVEDLSAEKELLNLKIKEQQESFEKELQQKEEAHEKALKAVEMSAVSKTHSYPTIAFGPEDWSRYFGEVDEVPPLPNNIEEILKSPCPYFEGQKVEDSHLLVLMPRTINGAPLTLNSLGELIQNPQGGGHCMQYRDYWDKLKEQKGEESISKPYWLLLMKDVIPGSRDKNFADQQKLVKGGYSVPKALEVAISLLMHHVRSGERLYSGNPITFTRCKEKFDASRVCVGGFGSSGLSLDYEKDDFYHDDVGLLLSWKLLGSTPHYLEVVSSSLEPSSSLSKLESISVSVSSPVESCLKVSVSYPTIAFGPEDWSRYFGEVDEVPPLPNNIEEILKGPCPYFEGQKVEDSHLLVLMPRTINGAPLTLNSLGELIQNPQGGGHRTKYRYYWSKLKEQKGEEGISKPYWLLLTKDVIPNSRNKTFDNQQKLIKRGYSVPKALEVTAALLMHHVRSGERLCSDNPWTYTRCEEKFNADRVCVGGFAPSGLRLRSSHYLYIVGSFSYDVGLLLSRKLLGP